MSRRTLTTNRRPPAKKSAGDVTQVPANGDTRRQLIAAKAYFLAERRGFTPDCELDDRLAAEAIVECRLRETPASGRSSRTP